VIRGLLQRGACDQARAIAAGRVTPGTMLQAQCEAIAALQPVLNGYVARAGALPAPPPRPADAGPLWGSSFAVKDNIDVAGFVTHAGLRAWGGPPAERDAPVVARLAAAGLACLGKANMHPMALGATNRNPDFGDVAHPRAAGRTPGGSSGGSAALVAAGLCGLALGTDTMGSVRIPAAYCGVVGFKPSHGLLPLAGVLPLCRLLDHVGVLARRVEDVAAALDAMWPAPDRRGTTAPLELLPAAAPRRVALLRDPRAAGADEPVARAFEHALETLRARTGWAFTPVDLHGHDAAATRRAGLLLCEAELHALLGPLLETAPQALPADLLSMMRYIAGRSAIDLGRALAQAGRAGEQLDRLTDGFDALLLPTVPQQAFAMEGPVPPNQADFTVLANMNGAPALSLPVPVAADMLPVGLQLVGQRGHDAGLLALAAQAEAALGGGPAA
jgi:Asp-tRNA(Asn)/Glu-tRNA(Gln) amidotransferase A subunit family amidase